MLKLPKSKVSLVAGIGDPGPASPMPATIAPRQTGSGGFLSTIYQVGGLEAAAP
jgi:hypothetical protein